MGKWNSSRVSSKLFVEHFGFHFNEREIEVRLPLSLVAEMKDYWTNRIRDDAWENYQLSVARCRVIVSELAITAEEQYEANLYGPAIGFLQSWSKQQNVSRVVEGAHLDMRLYSWPLFRSALRTKFGRASLATVSVMSILVIWACYRRRATARFLVRFSIRCLLKSLVIGSQSNVGFMKMLCSYALVQLRLVGVELNPGPAFLLQFFVDNWLEPAVVEFCETICFIASRIVVGFARSERNNPWNRDCTIGLFVLVCASVVVVLAIKFVYRRLMRFVAWLRGQPGF
jgi:hypothetical protein